MQHLFIDESGSMTKTYSPTNPYFVMCVLRVKDIKNLRKLLKRFIFEHYYDIKTSDNSNKIFKNGSFIELKGSSLSPNLKHLLATFLCNSDILEIYYIHINNKFVENNFYDQPSLAYNYVLYLLLERNLKNKNLPYDDYLIDIDERNLQKMSINALEEYLNIELKIKQKLVKSLNVSYYDSKDNLLVQVSDFFSNLYFSYLRNPDEYIDLLIELRRKKYIKDIYILPNQ